MTTSPSTLNSQLATGLIPLSNGRPGLRGTLQVTASVPPPSASADGPPHHGPEAPILDFVASDETLDRCDEVIAAEGWRLEHYRRNPVFQNAHQYGDILFTLGKALITEVRTGARPGKPAARDAQPSAYLYQRIEFAVEANPLARIAYRLYAGQFLNAVSVGFIPLRWRDGAGQASSPAGSEGVAPGAPRRVYLEQELLEVSAVGIPANPNALALGLKAGAIAKSDLRETLEVLRLALEPAPVGPQPADCNHQLLVALARELRAILKHA
jgi:hypothetical protein